MFGQRKTVAYNSRLERRLEKMPLVDILDWCDNNGTMVAKALDNVRKNDNKEIAIAEASKSVNELHQAVLHIAKRLGIINP